MEKEVEEVKAEKVPYAEQCRRALIRVTAVTKGETNLIANLANTSAVIKQFFAEISWVGFYLVDKNGALVLGPFQGKPACIHIQMGKGVCGTAAAEDTVKIVDDVNKFPGHIACDAASKSEIVVPIHHNGKVCAVLDIDSESYDRFNKIEAECLANIVNLLEKNCIWE